jgi:hypothetical protein
MARLYKPLLRCLIRACVADDHARPPDGSFSQFRFPEAVGRKPHPTYSNLEKSNVWRVI